MVTFLRLFFCVVWAGPLLAQEGTIDVKKNENVQAQKTACDARTDLAACSMVASAYEDDGQTEEALRYYDKLCSAGVVKGCLKVASYHDDVRHDPEKSVIFYRRACQTGKDGGLGCAKVAAIADGVGNKADAKRWRGKACKQGHKSSCN